MPAVDTVSRTLPTATDTPRRHLPVLLAGLVAAGLAVSMWQPHDLMTWFLETVWILVGLPLIVLTWRRFPLTNLLCALLALHAPVIWGSQGVSAGQRRVAV